MEAILLYVSIMAFTYLGYLIWSSKSLQVTDIAYRIIIMVLAIEVIMMWLFKTEFIQVVPHLMRVNSPLIFLLAPSFYMLLRGRKLGQKSFRSWDFIHLIPSITLLFFLLPFYFQSSQEKLILYHHWLEGNRVDNFPSSELYRLQQLVYAALITVTLFKKPKKLDTFVLVMVVAYLLIWTIDLYRYFFESHSYLMISTYLIAIIPVMIFFELNAKKKRFEKKYATSGLNPKRSKTLAYQVKELVEIEELFKDPKLSLSKISERLDVHHNYISQSINSEFEMSFSEMINSMRVKESKKLLVDEAYSNLTFEALAEMAGFNSVSSFNACFKRLEGETPSAFKKKSVLI